MIGWELCLFTVTINPLQFFPRIHSNVSGARFQLLLFFFFYLFAQNATHENNELGSRNTVTSRVISRYRRHTLACLLSAAFAG